MPKMTSASTRHYGKVFDQIATDYDRHRPSYPDKLIDYACRTAKLKRGDTVLELGCGSGQSDTSSCRSRFPHNGVRAGQTTYCPC